MPMSTRRLVMVRVLHPTAHAMSVIDLSPHASRRNSVLTSSLGRPGRPVLTWCATDIGDESGGSLVPRLAASSRTTISDKFAERLAHSVGGNLSWCSMEGQLLMQAKSGVGHTI